MLPSRRRISVRDRFPKATVTTSAMTIPLIMIQIGLIDANTNCNVYPNAQPMAIEAQVEAIILIMIFFNQIKVKANEHKNAIRIEKAPPSIPWLGTNKKNDIRNEVICVIPIQRIFFD